MPIKRRSTVPVGDVPETPQKLVIESKPKRPMPDMCRIPPNWSSDKVRRIGAVAASISDPTDELMNVNDYLHAMRSPYDKNNPQEARYRNRVLNRGTAITAMCITCQGGRKAVTECIDTTCPLWAFRFGGDPFYGKR